MGTSVQYLSIVSNIIQANPAKGKRKNTSSPLENAMNIGIGNQISRGLGTRLPHWGGVQKGTPH